MTEAGRQLLALLRVRCPPYDPDHAGGEPARTEMEAVIAWVETVEGELERIARVLKIDVPSIRAGKEF